MPGQLVDHINGEKLDNRRSNLRIASVSLNSQNRKPRGKSGALGVHWNKVARRWQVAFKRGGVTHYFGTFDNLDDARNMASVARERLDTGGVA
jgi:hypothetical protein